MGQYGRPNLALAGLLVVAYGRGFVLVWWYCNTLFTSGFMGDVMFTFSGPMALASLKCVYALDPAAWYWLHPVLDGGVGRQD